MKRLRSLPAVAVAVVALGAIASLAAQALPAQQAARPRRIAIFGSSVANGTGDELRQEGYTGRLRELLKPFGWEVLNQSRGGDNTVKMAPRWAPEGAPEPNTRYLMTVNPAYVVLGLSLGNEGLQTAKTQPEKEAIYKQFESGMRGFIAKSRANNIVPVVSLCYTRNDSTALDYDYTKKMNLLINSWDVPSVNFLGAVDDGTGKWADGFWNDALHPTAQGHVELTTTFVPTLFEAIEKGKPLPSRSTAPGFAHVVGAKGGEAAFDFRPTGTMHPFALAFNVRTQGDGSIAGIRGSTLTATTVPAPPPARGNTPPVERKVTTLSGGAPFSVGIGVRNGVWTYTASNGTVITSSTKADASWHQIVLSHYTARGETLFFVDGVLAGKVSERLQPVRFAIGGPDDARQVDAPAQADYKDVLVYRAALNADEVAALQKGTLLQASLEVYAPLADARLAKGAVLENRAQSMTALTVTGGSITHAER